ncbi:MAG: hypothetical protein QME05_00155 [Candidatus Margulisbacteria bacterium]|nr:hypothetical protein [Candidatus Margulisiibacteriota bacterium]
MEKGKRIYLIAGVLMLVVTGFYIGCGQVTSTPASTGYFNPLIANVTPVFTPSASAQAAQIFNLRAQSTTEWGAGNPLYFVYFSMREFVSSRDEGRVDRSNLYKLLTDVDSVFTYASPDAVAITEQVITPPFAGLSPITCNRATNEVSEKRGIALKETTNTLATVLGWIWSDSPLKNEYGIATATRDAASNNLTVDLAYSVDYDITTSETDYNLRGIVSGNPALHEFEFRYIIGNCQIVAKGISRGAGNYMLFKYAGFGSGTSYIVVPGTADEDWFRAQNTSPTNIYTDPALLPASVEAYKTWVVNTAFLTTSDLLTDTAVLNSGNSKQGTIYINYL